MNGAPMSGAPMWYAMGCAMDVLRGVPWGMLPSISRCPMSQSVRRRSGFTKAVDTNPRETLDIGGEGRSKHVSPSNYLELGPHLRSDLLAKHRTRKSQYTRAQMC